MPYELLVRALRESDLVTFKEIVSNLSLKELNAPNTIRYSNWFPGIGFTALQLTCMVRVDYASILIDRGMEVDFYSACALGNCQIIEKLLEEDVEYVHKAICGIYPIHFAIKKPSALKLLLENGDYPKRDILYLLWFDWEVKAAELGLANYNPIHLIAVGRGSVASAQSLFDFGADLNATSRPFGEAPIHLAAMYNKFAFITWLVENGVDVDALTAPRHSELKVGDLFDESYFAPFENSYGKTALMIAAGEGQAAAVKVLLQLNADPNACDSEGFTPLHYAGGAFWSANLEIVELLINAGAKMDSKAVLGYTPRDLALRKNYASIVELLTLK